MTKVKLRTKAISGNRLSLYLDFYPPVLNIKTGVLTRREFLALYLYSPIKVITRKNKDGSLREVHVYHSDATINSTYETHNLQTLQVAKQIEARRQNALNKPEVYNDFEKEQLKIKEKGKQDFVEYFQKLTNKKKGSNYDSWMSALNYFKSFGNGSVPISKLNESFCEDFKEYLLTARSRRSSKASLAKNSALAYFNKFKAALKQAYKDGLLQTDLNAKVSPIKESETHRKFLTIEEVNKLAKAECSLPVLKQAALFSALTGLRFSDIEKMIWGELEYISGQGYFIHFRQEKSEGIEVMPISDQAYKLLGVPKAPNEKVFAGLVYSAWTNSHLFKWLVAAGITKDITFHSFRHTYATLQLSNGTDIYTVSKMLGHRNLKTTQVYAHIIDKSKRDAANKIQLDL